MFLNQHRLDIWIKTHTGTAFSPTSLFANSETGGWWNPADHTTTFQDAAGTIPADTAGQDVLRINDKSGNGNHLILAGGNISNPVLRNSGALWWLEFPGGTSDTLTAAFTFVQPITRVSAAQIVTWNINTYLWDGGILNRAILDMTGSTPQVQMYAGAFGPLSTSMTVGTNHVATEIFNGASSKLAVDNGTYATGDPSIAATAGATIGGGLSGGTESAINWFGAVHIGRILTDPEIASCRTFFGNLAGLTL